MSVTIACPKCGSEQLSANKRGFSGGKALAGALLVGEIGLLAGTHGKNNIEITCLNCGKKFKPGEGEKKVIVSDGKGHSYDLNQLSGVNTTNAIICSKCSTPNKLQFKKCSKCNSDITMYDNQTYIKDFELSSGKSGCMLLLIIIVTSLTTMFFIIK